MLDNNKKSHIVISTNIEEEFEKIKASLAPSRVVGFITDKFLIEDAKAVIAESYISESQTKYIILGSYEFTNISQNSLLKVLEEPPRNIEYINSYYYPKKDMLMLGFLAHVKKQDFKISEEVDKAEWFDLKHASDKVRKGSIAMKLIEQCKDKLEIDTNDVSKMIIINNKIIK